MYSDDPSHPADDGGKNVLILPLGEESMKISTAAPAPQPHQ
jgi:hypothetical protein